MWKRWSSAAAAGILTISLVLPLPAAAVTYEDSFSECNYPKIFDLVVMRPISFGTTLLGFALFAFPAGPLAFATAHDEVGDVWRSMVGTPARFTFKRDLGECTGVDLSY
jgi:hypothetical protein